MQTKHVSPREAHRAKVTVTLRPERVAYADQKAREQGVSRSELIDALLAEAEDRDVAALMIAGYQALAHENLDLANEGLESFGEVIADDEAWPGAPEKPDAAR